MAGLPAIYENRQLFNNVDVDDAPGQARIVDFFLTPAFMGALVAPCVDDRRFFVAQELHGGTMLTP